MVNKCKKCGKYIPLVILGMPPHGFLDTLVSKIVTTLYEVNKCKCKNPDFGN